MAAQNGGTKWIIIIGFTIVTRSNFIPSLRTYKLRDKSLSSVNMWKDFPDVQKSLASVWLHFRCEIIFQMSL